MKYMGSKNRIAKEILPIILKNRTDNQLYIEPFVGGANMIDKVGGKRLGADVNEYLIELLKALQMGWIPPIEMTEQEYNNIKNNKDNYPKELTAFAGFGVSYSAKWFGGYSRGNKANGEPRNYVLEASNNMVKQSPNLNGIEFINCSYLDLVIPDNSIIYCDPPYKGTTGYNNKINHIDFWNWCREVSKRNEIFISEYSAPVDFKCIWEKEVTDSLGKGKATEKLFILK